MRKTLLRTTDGDKTTMREDHEIEKKIIAEMIQKKGFEKLDPIYKQRWHDLTGCPAEQRTFCKGCQRWKP